MNRNKTFPERLRSSVLAGIMCFVFLPVFVPAALVEITEDISNNTTWSTGNTYYINRDQVNVTNNAKLSIEAGVVVKFKPDSRISFSAGSSCEAFGSSSNRIYFTSRDDNGAGDSPADSDGVPEPGDWAFLEFLCNEYGVSSTGQFSYVNFRYGGHSGVTNFWGMARIQGASAVFQSCDFWKSDHAGIEGDILNNQAPEIAIFQCSFRDNEAYGIELGDIYETDQIFEPQIAQCSFSNNKTAAICLRQNASPNWGNAANVLEILQNVAYNGIEYTGKITRSVVWNKPGPNFPYCLKTAIASCGNLTVGPGVIIKMASDSLPVQPGGKVTVNGTQTDPVFVTSLQDDTQGGDTNGDSGETSPKAGDWDCWDFQSDNSSFARGVFAGAKFRYGGHSGVTNFLGMIRVMGSSVVCSGCDFWKSAFCGIQTDETNSRAPDAEITECTFRENEGGGIEFGSIYQNTVPFRPLVSKCHFSRNGDSAIRIRHNVFPDWGNAANTIDKSKGSGFNAVGVSGDLIFSGAWNPPGKDFPYYIAGGVNIQDGTTLTFGAGAIIKLGPAATIVAQPGSVLNFSGEADNPIVVTSVKDDSQGGDTNGDGSAAQPAGGDWTGILFQSDSGGKRAGGSLSYTKFLYGGGSWGMVRIAGCAPVIRHCEFHKSSEWAVTAWRDNNFAPEAVIQDCVISGNNKGVENQDSLYCLDATDNDWGHYSGPKDTSNADDCADYYSPSAQGDFVSDNVLVRPWSLPEGIQFLEVNTNMQARAVVKSDATLSIDIVTNNVELTQFTMTVDIFLMPGASINQDKSTHPHPFTAETFSGGVFTYYIDLGDAPQTGVVILDIMCDQAADTRRIPIRIEPKPSGDVNHDDAIDSADVVTLIGQILGK
ncbi:MAG TPA: hypothetical protein PLB62_04185 [Candidatus Sumerlaeota bacterium]|nr:hypothetical protein [Candidatus Sumerlaeota bacterium]